MFYTTNKSQGGSDLGLTIVKPLVTQKLKGNITIDNNTTIGTKFIVMFPESKSIIVTSSD